jgi:hypothetical protein
LAHPQRFSSLNTALDVVFQTNSPKGIAGVFLLRARLVSLGLVMGLAFLLVVSLVLDAAVQTVGNALFGSMALTVFAEVAQTLFGLVILTVGLGALIKWLSDIHVAIRPALIGGLIAAVLFTVGRHLFSFYLARAGTTGSFGAAGSLAVLMMWLYFCAAVFLLGAEAVAAISGTPSRDDSDADEPKPAPAGRQKPFGKPARLADAKPPVSFSGDYLSTVVAAGRGIVTAEISSATPFVARHTARPTIASPAARGLEPAARASPSRRADVDSTTTPARDCTTACSAPKFNAMKSD